MLNILLEATPFGEITDTQQVYEVAPQEIFSSFGGDIMKGISWVAIIAMVIIVLIIAFTITGIVGASISLYHALHEEEKGTFLYVSIAALALCGLGFFFRISTIIGFILMMISISMDTNNRSKLYYFVIPILAAAVAGLLLSLGINSISGWLQNYLTDKLSSFVTIE